MNLASSRHEFLYLRSATKNYCLWRGLGRDVDASSGQLGAQGLNKSEGERTYQGRGATTRYFTFGQSEFLLLFFTLLTFSPLAAHAADVSLQDFAVAPGVNLTSYDETIQQAAYSALTNHSAQTGIIYPATLTGDLSNVTVLAVRLRVGSLRRYGLTVGTMKIFPGLKVVNPNIRVTVIYRDFGGLPVYSSPLPGQSLVSPVVGIRVYSGDTVNTTGPLPPLSVNVLTNAIQITLHSFATPSYCVIFNSNGTTTTSNVSSAPYACTARDFGDYCLLGLTPTASPSPSPSPGPMPVLAKTSGKSNNAWKIAVGTVLGALGLLAILSLLACVIFRYRRRRRFAKMQFQTDQGETLRSNFIGNSRAPAAPGTRTRPMLEADHLDS